MKSCTCCATQMSVLAALTLLSLYSVCAFNATVPAKVPAEYTYGEFAGA